MFKPINYKYIPTNNSDSWEHYDEKTTGIPLYPHVGSFGVERTHHYHEGIDIYCSINTLVYAMEDGIVVNIEKFTGEHCGSTWWNNTFSIMIEGHSGVINYGELSPYVQINDVIKAGDVIGIVDTSVLKIDKGRPMTMLHIELYDYGTKKSEEWIVEKPSNLKDVTLLFKEWL